MIGAGGVTLTTPADIAEMVESGAILLAGRRALYEAGREYGRWEADHAICWQTSCLSCAKTLDAMASAHFDGERAGIAEALAAVEDSASQDTTVQEVLDVIKAKLARLLAGYQQPPAPARVPSRVQARDEPCADPARCDIPGHAAT